MYAGHVAFCPLVSHGEYATRTDRWTYRQMPDSIDMVYFLLVMANIISWAHTFPRAM